MDIGPNTICIRAEQTEADANWFKYTLSLLSDLIDVSWDGEETGATLVYGGAGERETLRIPVAADIGDGAVVLRSFDCDDAGTIDIPIYKSTICPETDEVDLFFNVFAYASCLEEYQHEQKSGPIHSYAGRLGWDKRRFDRPYAHYMALAIRRMIEKRFPYALSPMNLDAVLVLTHDIDVLRKTLRTRIKEGAFRFYNAVRNRTFDFGAVAKFVFSTPNYNAIPQISDMERMYGAHGAYNVFVHQKPAQIFARLKDAIFNPAYRLHNEPDFVHSLKALAQDGHEIGIHFGFDSWRDCDRMEAELNALKSTLSERDIRSTRQHWLRFSLSETWKAQSRAGLAVDTTLGFNDRPGYRAGLAHAFHPYDNNAKCAHDIKVIPTVLMDSQLYYYRNFTPEQRRQFISEMLGDLVSVGGMAAIIWHTHVFSMDHRWGEDYEYVLEVAQAKGIRFQRPSDC